MRCLACLILTVAVVAIPGCGRSRLAGTYRAEIRLMEGKQESTEGGYSLIQVQTRAARRPRILTIHQDGRYEWRSGDTLNEGNWRIEDHTLVLRDDTYNGIHISPALQEDRRWRIGDRGEIINDRTYLHCNLLEVYTRTE